MASVREGGTQFGFLWSRVNRLSAKWFLFEFSFTSAHSRHRDSQVAPVCSSDCANKRLRYLEARSGSVRQIQGDSVGPLKRQLVCDENIVGQTPRRGELRAVLGSGPGTWLATSAVGLKPLGSGIQIPLLRF